MGIAATVHNPEKFDAIVALGGGISCTGELTLSSQTRARMAVDMFRQGLAPRIITSGKWWHRLTAQPPITEAEAMQNMVIELGVAPSQVIAETRSQDTVGNAFFVKRQITEPQEWRRLALVTDAAHTKRAQFIFRHVMGPNYDIAVYPTLDLPSETVAAREALDLQRDEERLGQLPPGDEAVLTSHLGYLVVNGA